MNDLDRFIELLKQVDQQFKITTKEKKKTLYGEYEYNLELELTGNKVVGYTGFFTVFYFLDNKYMGCGSWE